MVSNSNIPILKKEILKWGVGVGVGVGVAQWGVESRGILANKL